MIVYSKNMQLLNLIKDKIDYTIKHSDERKIQDIIYSETDNLHDMISIIKSYF